MPKLGISEAKLIGLYQNLGSSEVNQNGLFYTWQYQSEANTVDSDFVFKNRKKTTSSFLNESQKTKGFDIKLSKFCHS
jgi:hypothetical protein